MDKSLAYDFMLHMWRMGRVNEAFIRAQVALKRLTVEEADIILTTQQNS